MIASSLARSMTKLELPQMLPQADEIELKKEDTSCAPLPTSARLLLQHWQQNEAQY